MALAGSTAWRALSDDYAAAHLERLEVATDNGTAHGLIVHAFMAWQLARVVGLSSDYNDAFVVMDATGNEALFEQLVVADVACEGVKFTNPAKQTLIDGLVLA